MRLLFNVLVTGLLLFLAVQLIRGWLRACASAEESAAPGAPPPWREVAAVFLSAVALRVIVQGLVLLIERLFLREGDALYGAVNSWIRWDAQHYINLAEQGYAGYTENGEHLFLVFFPLYVWLVRALRLLLPSTALAGITVSTLCYAGGCCYLYCLSSERAGRAVAQRAVLYLSLFPFSFFFGGVMTEGLFLLTSCAALYAIRRHRWLAYSFWGVLAALTRMHGALLIAAAAAELLESRRPLALPRGRWRAAAGLLLRRAPMLLSPLLGTLVYLGLNYRVTGDAFAFVRMQAHWQQGFHWPSDTLWYILGYAFAGGARAAQIWLPEICLFIVFTTVLVYSLGKQRSMLLFYAAAYLVLNYSLSWLLSAGRYLSCGAPFFLFAACLTEGHPRLDRAVTAILALLFGLYLAAFLKGAAIM